MIDSVNDRRVQTDWTLATLTEQLLGIRSARSAPEAIRHTIETAAEALDAEIAMVVRSGSVVDCLGFRESDLHAEHIWEATQTRFGRMELKGLGECATLTSKIEGHVDLRLMVARQGSETFPANEAALTDGLGSALGLMLNLLDRIAAERELRGQSEALLEITNAITRRFPHESIHRLVTGHARSLLRADAIIMRATDGNMATGTSLVICADGLTQEAATKLSMVEGMAGAAMRGGKIVEFYDDDITWFSDYLPGATAGIAAPLFVKGMPFGGLGAVSVEAGRRFTESERALLQALGELASIVLTDAQTTRAVSDAQHDLLTGLPGRGLILERLGNALAVPHRKPLAVLFLDLDGFKSINDRYGHEVGDGVLRILSGRMVPLLGARGEIGRIGGDEFLAYVFDASTEVEDRTGPDAQCADELIAEVQRPVPVTIDQQVLEVSVGVSIGIAVENGESTATDLVRRADAAMYRSKATGGNQWWRLV